MDIPINANVYCDDGFYGHSTRVILNPTTEQVTHLVVKGEPFGIERIAPIEMVRESTSTLIRLNGSISELDKLSPLTISEYLQPNISYGSYGPNQYVMLPYMVPGLGTVPLEHEVVVDHELIPPDELAVRRGTRVEATDGPVGRVSEFLVDRATGHISHLVLEEGPFWDKVDVSIPVEQVDRIENGAVYLKLDKDAVAALPSVPFRRPD
jgi:sporulation protein YlmC with PRC-barrel domain